MIKMQLWDCSGQKKFSSAIYSYIKGASGIILVYDITQESSFNAINNWIKLIKERTPNTNIVLVGQKCDLEEKRVISEEKGKELADELGIEFFEISAKNDYNIKEMFDFLIQQCIYTFDEASDIGAV